VKRMIRVLAVAVLVAVILVASMSPTLARRQSGGVLMPTRTPCDTHSETKNDRPGVEFKFFKPGNPEGRAPGCWALLPPSATQND
jgi:hypothetical protein